MGLVACPQCGETDALSGERLGDAIWITCESCGNRWSRDSNPICPKCGSGDVRAFPKPLIQKARGTAYSVVGQTMIYLCTACDGDEIAKRLPDLRVRRGGREDPWK